MLSKERGFSLIETMVAALFFAISLTGLMKLYEVIIIGKMRQHEELRSKKILYELLEQNDGKLPVMQQIRDKVPESWQIKQSEKIEDIGCVSLTIELLTPYNQVITANRWHCVKRK